MSRSPIGYLGGRTAAQIGWSLPVVILAGIVSLVGPSGGCKSESDRGKGQVLTLTAGPANPSPRDVPECTAGVTLLQLQLSTRQGEDVVVDSVTFTAAGTGDDALDLSAVWLVSDNDGNGILDGLDTVLGGPEVYAADDGVVTFSGLGRTIAASSDDLWILVYDLSGIASAGSTFTAQVASGSDVGAIGATSSRPVPAIGAPVEGSAVTTQPTALLSAEYADLNRNGTIDPSDSIIVTFSSPVSVAGSTLPDDVFVLDPPGTFGSSVLAMGPGPLPEQVEIRPRASSDFEPNGTYSTNPWSSGLNVASPQWGLLNCAGVPVQPIPSPVDMGGELNPHIKTVTLVNATQDCTLDAGERLEVTFTRKVSFLTPDPAQAFQLPVSGDSFGAGAQFLGGGPPADVDVATIVLGASPVLERREMFDPAVLTPGSPSGLDVTATAGLVTDARFPGVSALPCDPAGLDIPDLPFWSSLGDSQPGAWFGFSVAPAGDVNGDGFSDIMVGAVYFDSMTQDEGKAYVFHGGPSGPSPAPDWTSSGEDQVIAKFGASLASAGDVDGDGFSDIIVGTPDFATANPSAGKAYLYLGGTAGLSGSPAWTSSGDDATWADFGNSVASAGDVNNDGYADVIIGAPGHTSLSNDEGKAYLYLGGPTGLSTTPAWTSSGDDRVNAGFGGAVASAGDVNNDGYDDVVVGAGRFDTANPNAGKAYVFLGGAAGLTATAAWVSSGVDQSGAFFGDSVASAGDVNGDGFDDLAIGARGEDASEQDSGKAYLYPGGPTGPSASPAWVSSGDDQRAAGFGTSIASAGDVNGDGYSDVIVGADRFDLGVCPDCSQGKVYLYLGGPGGLSVASFWTSSGDNQADSLFGWAVASAGDVDGDGHAEVIVGARDFSTPTAATGKAYLFCIGP